MKKYVRSAQSGDKRPTGMLSYYRPQRSWGKVIFSQASVVPFTGEGGLPQCMLGYHPLPGPGRHPPAEHTGRYSQRAGGMHPTGIQSCFSMFLRLLVLTISSKNRCCILFIKTISSFPSVSSCLSISMFCFVFLKKILEDISPFCGATDTSVLDFWTSAKSQSGQSYSHLAEAYVSHVP